MMLGSPGNINSIPHIRLLSTSVTLDTYMVPITLTLRNKYHSSQIFKEYASRQCSSTPLSYTVVLVLLIVSMGLRGGDGMVIGITPMQSVPINTKVVSLNPAHGEVYSMQHFVIKFVSGVW